jgi:hypothetical protein
VLNNARSYLTGCCSIERFIYSYTEREQIVSALLDFISLLMYDHPYTMHIDGLFLAQNLLQFFLHGIRAIVDRSIVVNKER